MEKLKFIAIEDKLYPRGEKPSNCPKQQIGSQTFEFLRTPEQIAEELSEPHDILAIYEPCWVDCPLECPAKRHVEKVLAAISSK